MNNRKVRVVSLALLEKLTQGLRITRKIKSDVDGGEGRTQSVSWQFHSAPHLLLGRSGLHFHSFSEACVIIDVVDQDDQQGNRCLSLQKVGNKCTNLHNQLKIRDENPSFRYHKLIVVMIR